MSGHIAYKIIRNIFKSFLKYIGRYKQMMTAPFVTLRNLIVTLCSVTENSRLRICKNSIKLSTICPTIVVATNVVFLDVDGCAIKTKRRQLSRIWY